jgi:hypothetical protein
MLNVGKGNSTNLDLCREIGTSRVLHRSQPKALPTVTAEEVQAALARARRSAVIAERNGWLVRFMMGWHKFLL